MPDRETEVKSPIDWVRALHSGRGWRLRNNPYAGYGNQKIWSACASTDCETTHLLGMLGMRCGNLGMNKEAARRVLAAELASWRRRSYDDLAGVIGGEPWVSEVEGDDGVAYQLEVDVFWDDGAGGAVRVMGAVDDGGLRVFAPLTESFIMARDGSFVDE